MYHDREIFLMYESDFCMFLHPSLMFSAGRIFLKDSRSTALSYKKEKKRNHISRAEAYTNTIQTNAHNVTLHHHHHPGEELKASRQTAPLSPTLCHAKSRSPLQSRSATWTPPPQDYHPQAAHPRSSIPQLQHCVSRNSHRGTIENH